MARIPGTKFSGTQVDSEEWILATSGGGGGGSSASGPGTAAQATRVTYASDGAAVPTRADAAGVPLSDGMTNFGPFALNAGGAPYFVPTFGAVFNGSTWDRQRKLNGFSRITSTASTGSPTVAKSSAGDIGTFFGQNGAAITYLQLYNKASAPTIGTDTPVLTFPIPANAPFNAPAGLASTYFGTGIAYAFTTDAAGATAAAAGAVSAFNLTFA